MSKPIRYADVCVDESEHEWCSVPVYTLTDTVEELMQHLEARRPGEFDISKLTVATQDDIAVSSYTFS